MLYFLLYVADFSLPDNRDIFSTLANTVLMHESIWKGPMYIRLRTGCTRPTTHRCHL